MEVFGQGSTAGRVSNNHLSVHDEQDAHERRGEMMKRPKRRARFEYHNFSPIKLTYNLFMLASEW